MKSRKNKKCPHRWLSYLFALACCIWVSVSIAPVNAQTTVNDNTLITLKVTNQELGKALEEIKTQTDYTFFFNAELEKVKVSATLSNADTVTALNILLKNTGIEYGIAENSVWLTKSGQTTNPEDQTRLIRQGC